MPPLPINQAHNSLDLAITSELASLGLRDLNVREVEPAGSLKIDQIDQENSERLKELIAEIGSWPTISRFGVETVKAAWIVALHTTYNPPLQADFLRQMVALPAQEVDSVDRAYLEDRVLVNTGKPQRYGTIWNAILNPMTNNYDVIANEIDDEAGVETRRQSVGLPPMAVQQRQLAESLVERQAAAVTTPAVSPVGPPVQGQSQ